MSFKTILIVDDTFENLYLLKVILEKAGHHVIEATNGSEGLIKLQENNKVDLIISDILMPVMDGYLFCQACKKEKKFANIPFIFYTSTYTEKLDEDFAIKLGADNFLRKPIDHDEVLFTVNKIFSTESNKNRQGEKLNISEDEVLKLYSERLISKLEQKSLDLGAEVEERKKTEQLLIQKNEILDLIAVNTPLNIIFDKLLLNYEANHPSFIGSIGLFDEKNSVLNLCSAPSTPKLYNKIVKIYPVEENRGSCGTAVCTKKPVIVSDISKDKLWEKDREIALRFNFRSCWSIPILSKANGVLGTFALYSKVISSPSLEEIQELNFAVNLASIAIEKFRATEEIKKKDESYRGLINQASDAIMTYSLDGKIHDFNKASYVNLGYTKAEFLKLNIKDFIVGDLIINPEVNKKIQNGEHATFVRELKRKDNSIIEVEISAKLQKDGRLLAIVRDITERKKAANDLRRAKEFTDKLIMSMQEGLVILDLKGKIIMVNDSFCEIMGYKREEVLGMQRLYSFVSAEKHGELKKIDKRIVKGEAPSFYFEFIKKNGEKFIASFLTGFIKDDKGQVIAFFGTMKDVSEEEKAKKVLEEKAASSNKKKEVILELAKLVGKDFNASLDKITELAAKTLNIGRVSIWSFNNDRTSLFCEKLFDLKSEEHSKGIELKTSDNPKYFKALNNNETIIVTDVLNDSITKSSAKDYLIPFNITSLMDVFVNSTSGYYGILSFEHLFTPKFWTAEDQEFATSVASIVSLMIESSERKTAEIELKLEKEFSEELVTSLHDGMSVVDTDGVHIKINPALCEMTGFNEKDLLGIKAPFPYWPPEEYDNIYKAFNNPTENLGSNLIFTLMRKNGERFPASLSSSAIKNNDGEIIAYFTTIKDIALNVKAENILKENIVRSDQRKNIIIKLASLIGEDFDTSMKTIVKTAAKALDVALVTIWEYKKNDTELLSNIHFNRANNKIEKEMILITREEFPEYFDAFINKTSLNISDVASNPITKALSDKQFNPVKVSSRIDVIVYGRTNNYGIISFECLKSNRVFSAEEESFATSMASIVSLMIESKERTLAEKKTVKINELLVKANVELIALRNQLEQENVYLRNELDLVFNFEEMVYGSEAFSNVLSEVEKVAPTSATVLLLGESGTGKELLARAIHNISTRNNKPLIKVNCSAIPRELIESELFGHKKGSFTGAFSDKKGKFELADEGTLFLDEIGELPLDMQPKILRFLQEGEIEVVGGAQSKKLNVRVIAATNRNLVEEIEKKQFREDLYFRLNVFPIIVPPLRKRKDDIPLLVEHFVDKFNKAYDKNIKYITDDSMIQLKSYDWPGNIRELENLIERAAILSNNETLLIPGFESTIQKGKHAIKNKDLSFDSAQRNHIIQVLEQCNWKISGQKGACALLELKPSTLRDKMKKLGIIKPVKK